MKKLLTGCSYEQTTEALHEQTVVIMGASSGIAGTEEVAGYGRSTVAESDSIT
jgi:hypothetical protein